MISLSHRNPVSGPVQGTYELNPLVKVATLHQIYDIVGGRYQTYLPQ